MFSRFLFISAACILFLFLIFQAADQKKSQQKTRIILITAESLRADMVTTENCPELLHAAQAGYQFRNYRAISGWTGTNIVSLLSGLTPFESGVHTRGQSVNPSLSLPLKQLKKEGYAVTGLQPFMVMDIYKNLGLSVAETSPDPLLWLAKKKTASHPFFLWYHYVHTHLPYSQPQKPPFPFRDLDADTQTRLSKVAAQSAIHFDEATYSIEDKPHILKLQETSIKEFDRWFSKLWSFYNSGGFFRDTILIVTADHGDEHGERHMVGHASTTLAGHLHEEIVRIPLFIWLPPNLQRSGFDSRRLASHIDIMPTLWHLLKKSPLRPFQGNSLFTDEPKNGEKSWTAMTSSGGFAEPDPDAIRYFEYSHIRGNWKSKLRIHHKNSINQDEFRLYNLIDDPNEQVNVASENPKIVQHHKKVLSALIETEKMRPVAIEGETNRNQTTRQTPQWIHPSNSGSLSYSSLRGQFFLQWSGSINNTYLLEYTAGYGQKLIHGTLEVSGNIKQFGNISKLYWQTWIVPSSPFTLRVKEVGGHWSKWITLEAIP